MHKDRPGHGAVVIRKPYEPPRAAEVAAPFGVAEAAPAATPVFFSF